MDNNVPERIDDYLDQVFGPYEDSPTACELRIEIRHDLLERLSDLIGHGIGDEVAYAQVISSVGDIDAMVRELAEQDRAADAGAGGTGCEPEGLSHTLPGGAAEGQAWASDQPQGTGTEATGSNIPRAASAGFGSSSTDAPGASSSGPDSPGSEAPGTDSTGRDSTGRTDGEPPYTDWSEAIADMVAQGLEQARDQISGAMRQVEDALNQAGMRNDRYRHNHARDWERRWARDERRNRMSYAASDLRGGDFRNQNLADSSFNASSMRNSNFCGSVLTRCTFRASDLRNCDFSNTDLTGGNLNACSLRGAIFDHTNLTDASLSASDMRSVRFVGASLAGARAAYADLRQAVFSDCAMDQADFSGADLRDARFDGLALTGVTFDRANLSDTSFRGSTLHNVSFHFISRKSAQSIVFEDTVMDQATYMSLRASGHNPQGVRVES
ncbi:MAG: pentapeptide repeat-containing protein [Propionibacteriaceae bacterium]|nr:pentapeptide repeat-containing protein [Propionibacteriaceae bacterium]